MAAQPEVLVQVADVLGRRRPAAGRRTGVTRPIFIAGLPPPAARRRAARSRGGAASPPGSRGRGRCRRGGPGRRRSARASRPCLRSWRAERPELAGGPVERAVVMRRAGRDRRAAGRPPSRPGNVVQPVPIASSAWASLLPTSGRPCSSANADDAAVPRPAERRRVERLDARPGGRRGSASSSSRRRTQPWAHSGYGTSGWAGMARPPCVVDRRRSSSAASGSGRIGRSMNRAPAGGRRSVVTSSPTTTSTGRPRSRAIVRAATRGVDPLVVGDRDDVEVGRALDVVEDRRDRRRSRREASVWMWRSARPRRVGHRSCRPASGRRRPRSPPARRAAPRGPARSGRRPPTTAPARRR